MVVSTASNRIAEILGVKQFSNALQHLLRQQYVNIDATLLRSKVLRNFSKAKTHVMIQSAIPNAHSSLAYLFAPFVLAHLNQKVIYTTPATDAVCDVLHRDDQADIAVFQQDEQALTELNVLIDLLPTDLLDQDFLHLALVKALCRSDLSQIFLLSHLSIDLEKCAELEQFFQIKIKVLPTQNLPAMDLDAPLDLRQLLFKDKDQRYRDLCNQFSILNGQLLIGCDHYSESQLRHLVEDMFYSEHLYEKLSVYSEFIQTRKKALQLKQQATQLTVG